MELESGIVYKSFFQPIQAIFLFNFFDHILFMSKLFTISTLQFPNHNIHSLFERFNSFENEFHQTQFHQTQLFIPKSKLLCTYVEWEISELRGISVPCLRIDCLFLEQTQNVQR